MRAPSGEQPIVEAGHRVDVAVDAKSRQHERPRRLRRAARPAPDRRDSRERGAERGDVAGGTSSRSRPSSTTSGMPATASRRPAGPRPSPAPSTAAALPRATAARTDPWRRADRRDRGARRESGRGDETASPRPGRASVVAQRAVADDQQVHAARAPRVAAMRSNRRRCPFCSVSRAMMPASGASGRQVEAPAQLGSPARRRPAAGQVDGVVDDVDLGRDRRAPAGRRSRAPTRPRRRRDRCRSHQQPLGERMVPHACARRCSPRCRSRSARAPASRRDGRRGSR